MSNNDDFEEKKKGFVEILKLIETSNAIANSKDKASAMAVAKVFKNQYDAFISVGFTREESIQLLSFIISNVSFFGGK